MSTLIVEEELEAATEQKLEIGTEFGNLRYVMGCVRELHCKWEVLGHGGQTVLVLW